MSSGYVKNIKQSDHKYMILNYGQAYIEILKDIITRMENIEFSSVLEFNPGKVGMFVGLLANPYTEKKIKNYRLMDSHPQCVADCYSENETARSNRPDVGFATHVGNIWEYESVVPVQARYRADIVVVHYLSATPEDKLDMTVNEICRTSVNDIIVLDYAPADCSIDIEKVMKEEMPDCVVHTSVADVQDKLLFNYCLYHVVKPPRQ
jgi:hypothetical protein